MFLLRERTRRRLCQAFFIALCIVPTLFTLASLVGSLLPGHTRDWEHSLSQRLLHRVAIDAVRHPTPSVTELHNVRLANVRSEGDLLTCPLVRLSEIDGVTTIVMTRPRLSAAAIPELFEDFQSWQQREAISPSHEARFIATGATIDWGNAQQAIARIEAYYDGNQTTKVSVRFWTTDAQAMEPVRLDILCTNREESPQYKIEMHTANQSIPVELVAEIFPSFGRLGETATWQGSLWLTGDATNHRGEAAGRLQEIELAKLTALPYPHSIEGTAQLTLRELRWQGEVLQTAVGNIQAGAGRIDRALLDAAARNLDLTITFPLHQRDAAVPFDQLACAFSLSQAGLQLRGECPTRSGRGILVAGGNPLVGEPRRQPLPAAALVGLFANEASIALPVSPRSAWVLRHLPTPAEGATEVLGEAPRTDPRR